MGKIKIIAEGQSWDTDGNGTVEDLPVGTVLEHPDAWMHCLPGFRNSPPIAEPADDETRAQVDAYLKATAAHRNALAYQLQNQVNALAADKRVKLQVLPNGDVARDSSGEIKGNLSQLQRHRLETALAYGIKPTPPAEAKPAATASPAPAVASDSAA